MTKIDTVNSQKWYSSESRNRLISIHIYMGIFLLRVRVWLILEKKNTRVTILVGLKNKGITILVIVGFFDR